MALKNWITTINDEWYGTGGGFDYFITFYRSKKNPKMQIEVWQESNYCHKRLREIGVNIGYLPFKPTEDYEPIQGDYIFAEGFKTKRGALAFVEKFRKKHSGKEKRNTVSAEFYKVWRNKEVKEWMRTHRSKITAPAADQRDQHRSAGDHRSELS